MRADYRFGNCPHVCGCSWSRHIRSFHLVDPLTIDASDVFLCTACGATWTRGELWREHEFRTGPSL